MSTVMNHTMETPTAPRAGQDFASDCASFSAFWGELNKMLAALPTKSERSTAQQTLAQALMAAGRESRESFLTQHAKAVYDLTPRDRIWLVNIAGVDEIRLGLSESTDLDEEIANFDIRYDGWRSATGFNWQRTFGSRGVGLLGISHSQAKVGQQVKDLVAQGVPPPGVPRLRPFRMISTRRNCRSSR